MLQEMDSAASERLEKYFGRIGGHLRDRRKRESFAIYAYGILGESERKSVEPIAAQACGEPDRTKNMHDKLLHFVGRSDWSDQEVRLEATRYACAALSQHEELTTWVIDDTGFLKQGTHSVGVQRQYTGSAGKVTNCQVAVSLEISTPTQHVPVDFELYLPQSWTNDDDRRCEARIPEGLEFKTKVDLALDMIRRAQEAQLPGQIILADSAYGDSSRFRQGVRELGLDYAVGIKSTTKVRRIGARDRLGKPLTVAALAKTIPRRQRRKLCWREGTQQTLQGRFSFCRVKTTHDDSTPIEDREPVWLVIEWPPEERQRIKFHLTTLPRRMNHRELVRTIKERWRTERMYEDLKGELGLDHFEGRSFPGWHHHVSVVICCYAFVVAERARAFPPSAGRKSHDEAVRVAA